MYKSKSFYKLKLMKLVTLFVNGGRIFWGACKKFHSDNCFLYTSSLTYYSVLSIVPVIAMCFAIAKGFGMEAYLKNILFTANASGGQQKIWVQILSFSDTLLSRTKGGLIAGIGIVILLWSVWSVLHNIESSFNKIWKLKYDRTWIRKITDYVSIIFLFPIVIMLSLGATIYIESLISDVVSLSNFTNKFGFVVFYIVRLFPTIFSILLITSLYIIIPNIRISFKAALSGGIFAGILFQVFEYLYIHYQIKLTSYNVIYGSFAALPFLFLWIFYSWTIIFLGMEIVIIKISHTFSARSEYDIKISFYHKKLLCLCIIKTLVENFKAQHNVPITIEKLSKKFALPIKTTEKLLSMLHMLSLIELVYVDAKKGTQKIQAYQPAFDIYQMKITTILSQLDRFCVENKYSITRHHKDSYIHYFATYLQEAEQYMSESAYNKSIADMPLKH